MARSELLVLYNHSYCRNSILNSLWSCSLSVFINSINYCVFLGVFTTSAYEVLPSCDEGTVGGRMGISPPPSFKVLLPVPPTQGEGAHAALEHQVPPTATLNLCS